MLKAILVTLAVSLGVLGCAKKEEPAATNAPGAAPPIGNQSQNPAPPQANAPHANTPQANTPQSAEPAKSPEESGKEHIKNARDKAKDTEKELAAGALDLLKAKLEDKIDKQRGDGSSDAPKDPVKQ